MRQDAGLRTIFSIFLGLMLNAFVGVGVYTFHPPSEQSENQIRDLARREATIRNSRPTSELSPADQDRIQQIDRERRDLVDAATEARKPWGRSTSMILIAFATLIMAVSLVRAEQLPVISNGLLLGGLFTMLYGVGWIVATDTSVARFVVMTVALVITLGLGYVRFVRRATASTAAAGATAPESIELTQIERRIQDLEDRMNDAAHAFARNRRET